MSLGRGDPPGLVALVAMVFLVAGVFVVLRAVPAGAEHDGSVCVVGATAPATTPVPEAHDETACAAAAPTGGVYTWTPATTTTTTTTTTAPTTTTTTEPPTTTTTAPGETELSVAQETRDATILGQAFLVFAAFAFLGLKAGH